MKSSWSTKRIGDVCTVMTGGTPSKSNPQYFGGHIKWLVSGDIHRGEIHDCEGRITEAGAKNSNAKVLPLNSVMIALNGQGKTRGTVAILRTSATCNQSLVAISPNDSRELLSEFLFLNLHSRYRELRRMTGDSGKDRRGLNMGLVRRICVPVPPLHEQQRIVDILETAFGVIGTAKANAAKNIDNGRELFNSHLELTLAGGGENWRSMPLSNLCTIKHGFAFKSEFFTESGNYVLLTPGNFYESGGFRDRGEKQKYYKGEIPDGFILKRGDLLVAMTEQAAGLLGSSILVPDSDRFLHNQRLGLVEGKSGVPWVNEFFFHVFNTKRVRAELHRTGSGVKVRHTSPKKIGDVVVHFPQSVSEQHRLVAQLRELATHSKRLESFYNKKLDALNELKTSLLHQAFSGQLTRTSAREHSVTA